MRPQIYINVSRTIAVTGVIILGIHYLNIQRDAVGIQKKMFKDRIKDDLRSVAKIVRR